MISACVNGHSEFTQWPVADLVTHRDESRADVFTFFGNKCTALPWMCHLMISSCSVSESAPSTSPGCSLWAPSSGADSKLHPSVFYHFLWWNILDQRRFEGASKQQRQRKLASLRAADLNSVCVVCVCVRERETAVCVCVWQLCVCMRLKQLLNEYLLFQFSPPLVSLLCAATVDTRLVYHGGCPTGLKQLTYLEVSFH